jgi:hypothetical protein
MCLSAVRTDLITGDFDIETGVKLNGCALPAASCCGPVSSDTVTEGFIGVE